MPMPLSMQSGRAVGYLTLLRIVPEMRVIEVGHVLYSPALQRTPLGTEAQYLLARYVFETLGYRRYEWKCNSFNAPSWRAALRYGFIYEGTFRNYIIAKGRNRDDAWFSMLDSEWPARKRNFERWLAPENFDGDGRQKMGLAELTMASAIGARNFVTTMPSARSGRGRYDAGPRSGTGDAEGPLRRGGASRPGARCRRSVAAAGAHGAYGLTYRAPVRSRTKSRFTAWLVDRKTRNDPYFFAVLDHEWKPGRPAGLHGDPAGKCVSSRLAALSMVRRCSARRLPPKPNTFWRVMPSKRWVTGVTNGNAMH